MFQIRSLSNPKRFLPLFLFAVFAAAWGYYSYPSPSGWIRLTYWVLV